MLLTLVVTRQELVDLIEAATPLHVIIDERRGRAVTVGRPSSIELVPGRGLRIRGEARVGWDVAGVAIPVTIQNWQILLVPAIAARGSSHVLSFEPVVEALDIKHAPPFVDSKIAAVVRDGIAHNRDRLAWDFARALSKRLPIPPKVGPARVFELAVDGGEVAVDADSLRLAIRFEARVEKRAPAAARAPQSVRALAPVSVR